METSLPEDCSTISMWTGHAMPKLGYAATPSIDYWTTYGQMQLAFDSIIYMFSLMLLPGLWHRCDCPVEK